MSFRKYLETKPNFWNKSDHTCRGKKKHITSQADLLTQKPMFQSLDPNSKIRNWAQTIIPREVPHKPPPPSPPNTFLFPLPHRHKKKGTIFKTSILQTTIAGENSNPPPKFGVGRRSESAVAVACCMQLADLVNPSSICAQYFSSL
jgi:hypothetical protein